MGMDTGFRNAAHSQVQIEMDVKRLLQAAGVQPALNHFYMTFAKKLVAIARKHRGTTACDEIDMLVEVWRSRQLDLSLLNSIRGLYTSCPAIPAAQPFRMDISLLDGPDTLV